MATTRLAFLLALFTLVAVGCAPRGRGGGGGRSGGDRCGDFRVSGTEQCDDGNTADGDGCSASCMTEPDTCGDGTCDMAGGETCTNCGADCAGDVACAAMCGDGRRDESEECDDGNLESGDGCSEVCTTEEPPDPCGDGTCDMEGGEGCESCPLDCSSHPACIPASCGDGTVNTGEECDDGGESATCDGNCTRASCGDLTTNVTAGEQCDAGAGSAECDVDCSAVECGDATVNTFASETCDDGNLSSGDGCSASCAVEAGWRCEGASCSPVCGDGIRLEREACDDGNFSSGDGCSASCLIEEGWSCEGSPSSCSRGVTRGALVITEIMADPTMVTDTNGEWFEVYNASGSSLDLRGLTFTDGSLESFTVSSSVVIPAGGRAVLGRNASSTINGGLRVDYAYGTAFNLSNTTDVIEIRSGTTSIDRVAYDSAFRIVAGRAGSLNAIAHDSSSNDLGSNWCSATATYGMGDYGTPGMDNPTCGGGGGMRYDYSRTPGLSIPDNNLTGVTDSLTSSAFGCSISSVTVDVRITHPYIGDLRVVLSSPSGTSVTLHMHTGSSSDNIYGTYPTTLTVADPAGLAAFNGEIGSGTWRLTVSDEASADLGTLDSWGIHLTCF